MRLLDAVFDVLRRAGEPLSPAEITRRISSARIQIDANEPFDDESVKVELEHVVSDDDASGIVRTPTGRFTLPTLLERTIQTGTSIATAVPNPIGIASALARANTSAAMTVMDATQEILRRAKRPLSVSEMTTMLRAAGVLRGDRSDAESEVRSRLIEDMLQHGRESTFVRVGNNTYTLRYHSAGSAPTGEASFASATNQTENDTQTVESSESESEEQGPLSRAITAPSRLARDIVDSVDSTTSQEDAYSLLQRIRTLSNQQFERFIVVFLATLGMTDVVVLNRLRPGELDMHASISVAEVMNVRFSIQALNWNRDVHGGDIRTLRGSMRIGDHGLIITTSEFQSGALEEATREGAVPIATINGAQLAELAQERGAGKVLG